MDNVHAAHELPDNVLRNCVNYDIGDTGKLRRRRGSSQVYAGNIATGTLWAPLGDDVAYFVEGSDLKRLEADNTATTLRSGVGNHPMAYLDVNSVIYYSNGEVTGIIESGNAKPWGIERPARQPSLVATTEGSLAAGTYQVAVTFVSSTGEESGTGLANTVNVQDQGGIQLNSIPQPADLTQNIRVYVSTANGEQMHFLARLRNGQTQYNIQAVDNVLGRALETQFGIPTPPASVLEYHNARIYAGAGNVLWCTDPGRYGLVKPQKNFYQFAAPITILAAVVDGMYIVADKTYWLSGIDTGDLRQVELIPYGAVPGTMVKLPNDTGVAWWSHKGLVLGRPGGEASNISQNRVAVSKFKRGTAMFRESNGLRQHIAILQDGTPSPYQDTAYAASETTRKGNAI